MRNFDRDDWELIAIVVLSTVLVGGLIVLGKINA